MTERNGETWGIVGSRSFRDKPALHKRMGEALDTYGRPARVVSGGATGADTYGVCWAQDMGLPTLIYAAEWSKYGKRAGAFRNQRIVDDADRLFVFNHGEKLTPGTAITVRMANIKGIPVFAVFEVYED